MGDICLLGDAGVFRGEWRMCKVSETYPDRKGVVRNIVQLQVGVMDLPHISHKFFLS